MAEKKFDVADLKKHPYYTQPFLKRDSLKNRMIGDACTGYSFKVGSMSYRGVWVSTIEDIDLKVDGVEIPKEEIIFCVNGKKFLAPQLKELFAEYWYPHSPAEVIIYKIGGLAPGAHEIDMTIWRHNDFGYSHEFVASPNYDCATLTIEA